MRFCYVVLTIATFLVNIKYEYCCSIYIEKIARKLSQ